MGFLDFFNDQMKEMPEPRIKETPWAKQNRDIIQKNITGAFGGMTPLEQEGQGILASLLRGGMFEDPAKSQYYQGLRNVMQQEEDRGVNALRRRQQMSGMYNSSPAMSGEALYRSDMANRRMGILGNLYNQERQRDNPYTRLGALGQYGGLNRQIAAQQSGLANSLLQYQPWYTPQMYMAPSQYGQIGNAIGGIGNMIGTIGGLFR